MTPDTALDLFIEDAKRQGLSFSEYERKYGVILVDSGPRPSAAAQLIRRHEINGGTMTEDSLRLVAHKEKRRADARRSERSTFPPADCE